MNKRLAFLLPDMRGGGAERVALTLMRYFVARGHQLDLLLMKARGELLREVPPSVRIFDLGVDRIRRVLPGVRKYLQEERPDALQVFMWPLTVVGIVAHRLSRSTARLVVSNHAVLSDHYPGRPKHILIALTHRLVYAWADVRVSVSHATALDIARLSGLPVDFFTVIHNPIEFPDKIVRNSEIEALWQASSKRILTLGHLTDVKRQDLLIRAFAKMSNHDAKLMIAGAGPLLVQLQDLAKAEGVADRVLFPGYVEDPWPYYASAHLFVLPSREESFGNVVVEALHAGLPIVSTPSIGAVEVLKNGEFGTLVLAEPAALAAAMESALIQTHDPEPGRARAMELSGRSVERYEDVMLKD